MSKELKNDSINIDTKIVENLNPSLVVGSNDEEVQNSLNGIEDSHKLSQQIMLNVGEHKIAVSENESQQSIVLNDSTTSNDWQANFTNVSVSNSMESISKDLMALSILNNRSYSEQLLQNNAIVYQSVQTDAFGKPKAFAGLKMLQITKDIKTQQPILTLSHPQRYDFQTISNNKSNGKNDLVAILNYDIANEIADKLINKFGVKREISEDKDLKLLFSLSDKDKNQKPNQELLGKEAFLAINAIQRIGFKYLINDSKRTDFFRDLEKNELAIFSKDTTRFVKGDTFLTRQNFSMENVPTTYKGVKLTPLQAFQLAKGNPVSIEGIKDDKVEGLYTANVKLDVFNGKKIEGDRKVSTESLDKSTGVNAVIEKIVEKNPSISKKILK